MQVNEEFPSRDLTFEWGRTAPDELFKVADAIDTKTLGIFATASLIIGVAAALVRNISLDLPHIPFGISALSYLLILCVSVWVLWGRKFSGPSDPSILREHYWKLQPDDAKAHYWSYAETHYKDTYPSVRLKGRLLSYAVPLLGVQVVALIVWLFLLTILD